MESVENCPFYIGSTLKIVENSVENVEKGFVMGWILDDGSGKKYKFIIENYDVFWVHVLGFYEQVQRLYSLYKIFLTLKTCSAFTPKTITENYGNELISTNRKKFLKSYCKLKKTL